MISFSDLLTLSTAEWELPCEVKDCRLFEARGYRWLCSDPGAVQTALSIDDPSAVVLPNHQAMLLATLLPVQVSSVLDLGVGGGGFMRHFRAWAQPPRLSGVEHSGEMLHAARQHFALPPEQLIHVGDAVDFLGRDRARYDLIMCDLFDQRSAPAALQEELFFASLARRLNPGAAVALNTLPASTAELTAIVDAACEHFSGVGILPIGDLGNVLLFLQEDPLPTQQTLQTRLAASIYADHAAVTQALASLRRLSLAEPNPVPAV